MFRSASRSDVRTERPARHSRPRTSPPPVTGTKVLVAGVFLALLLQLPFGATASAQVAFIRGDSNSDFGVNIADAIFDLNYIFIGGPPPAAVDAVDVNDNGVAEISDVTRLLSTLFVPGSPPIPAPFPSAGFDTTAPSFPASPTGLVEFSLGNETGCAGTQTIVSMSITNSVAVEALSVRIVYDPAFLAVSEVDDAPLSLLLGGNPDFMTSSSSPGLTVIGTLFSFIAPSGGALQPQVDAPIFNLTIDVAGAVGPGVVVPIDFEDDPTGTIPMYNLASIAGEPELALKFSGTITGSCVAVEYRRGDFNEDGVQSVTDAVLLVSYLFQGGLAGNCEQTGDANSDGTIDIADVVTLLDAILGGGPPLPAPFPGCGVSTTASPLSCNLYLGGCP